MVNTMMKKASLLAVAVCLVVGCGKQDAPAENAAATQAPATATTPDSPAPTAPEAAAPVAVAVASFQAPANLQPGGNCSLDAINGGAAAGASVKAGSEVMFAGWVADAANQVPKEALLVLTSGANSYSAPLVADAERPDVAAALAAESLKNSGYNVLAKLDVVPGTYELSIVHGPVDAAASCPLKASMTVTE